MAKHVAAEEELAPLDLETKLIHRVMDELRAKLAQNGRQAETDVTQILEQAGALVFPALRAWSADPDPRVRKSLIRVVAQAADPRDPFRASLLFDLVEPLLWDEDPGVRASARRVLREKLIPTYPEEALQALARWAAEPSTRKQILAAQGLTRLPPHLARRALIPLRHLVRTEQTQVRRAALGALKVWRARAPEALETELQRWKDVPELAPFINYVAESVCAK